MKKTNTNVILKRIFVSALSLAIIFVSAISTTELASAKEVEEKFPVHIHHHNIQSIEYVSGGAVSDVLRQADITLSQHDVMNVKKESELRDSMLIKIDQVKFITDTDTKKIKFETEYQKSDEHPVGFEEVTKNGKNGEEEITTTYKYVNGERHSIAKRTQKVLKKPQNKVVLKGTAQVAPASNFSTSFPKPITNSTNTINGLSYSRVLTGSATAYTANEGALTATGVPAYVGGVAVNPNIIPYGSKLYIVADGYTYGYATAVDTGGALMSGTALVDLYMSTYDECINFGRRNVTVYVLS